MTMQIQGNRFADNAALKAKDDLGRRDMTLAQQLESRRVNHSQRCRIEYTYKYYRDTAISRGIRNARIYNFPNCAS